MAKNFGGEIMGVEKGSIAFDLGLSAGDFVSSVNGRLLKDEIDFRFYSSAEFVTLTVIKKNGDEEIIEIEKDEDDHLGITFKDPIFDAMKTCRNECQFCFVRQIPKFMRPALHVKDDDYRMSFLFGNFISLTNLSEEEFKRIEEQKLSPLRVSVHTTDGALRQKIMGNPRARDIMRDLRRLCYSQIRLHIQIVLMRGVNDGENLNATLRDLYLLGPNIVSVGVVPAVYTKYRKNPPSAPIDGPWAFRTLSVLEAFSEKALAERGDGWVMGADELYVLAKKDFPPYERYGDFHQFENGIGIIPEFRNALRQIVERPLSPKGFQHISQGSILAVTGQMAKDEIFEAVNALGLKQYVSVLPVTNGFYGENVTASGLLTGGDIIEAVKGLDKMSLKSLSTVLIPSVAVFDDKFLDDVTLSQLEAKCGISVKVVEPAPQALVNALSTVGVEK